MSSSWMTKEIKAKLTEQDRIAKEKDMSALFNLKDNQDFAVVLCEILYDCWERDPDSLNHAQRVLLFCMQLENFCQADGILSFLQDEFADFKLETIQALYEVGAQNSAKLIEKAVEMIPKDGIWFLKVASDKERSLMNQLSSAFAKYPDGYLYNLYRDYANKYKDMFLIK